MSRRPRRIGVHIAVDLRNYKMISSIKQLASSARILGAGTHIRMASTWSEKWRESVANIRSDVSYDDSSKQLRKIIKDGLLRFTDLRDDPHKFFQAHKILALHSPVHGPGFWIRFTVQYNLFAGIVIFVTGST